PPDLALPKTPMPGHPTPFPTPRLRVPTVPPGPVAPIPRHAAPGIPMTITMARGPHGYVVCYSSQLSKHHNGFLLVRADPNSGECYVAVTQMTMSPSWTTTIMKQDFCLLRQLQNCISSFLM
ncbi:unnamed protein product, partial [Meganyctiphanes norvegica]